MKLIFEMFGMFSMPASQTEKIVSAIGGFFAIVSIFVISSWSTGEHSSAMIVTSMGASAVLLFAVPHGPMSQPWPVFGGHVISAIIGVTCASYVSNEILAASLAVGIAIGVMYYLHCIHPPGGATALAAVLGGDTIQEMGYGFVVTPIMLNVVVILIIAVVFNYHFKWRRYPSVLNKLKRSNEVGTDAEYSDISHEDFVYALSQIDSFVDINEQDLLRVYDLAIKKSQQSTLPSDKLVVGGFYSNGQYGEEWAVRMIVEESGGNAKTDDMIIYKVVAGRGRRSSGYSTRNEFLRWTKHQVIRDEENWKRVDG